MNGIFSFAIYDSTDDKYFIARDHIGIIPLYIGWDSKGTFYVSSELKSLESNCEKIELFPPGHYLSSDENGYKKWYSRDWESFDNVKNNSTDIDQLEKALSNAVHSQLMSDVPYGVLLSGGLDSFNYIRFSKKICFKKG